MVKAHRLKHTTSQLGPAHALLRILTEKPSKLISSNTDFFKMFLSNRAHLDDTEEGGS